MVYRWNGACMSRVAVLPAAVKRYLKLASETQLKVLLWMATSSEGGDAAACAAALGGRASVAACEDALRFWVGEGFLVSDASVPVPALASSAAVSAASPSAASSSPLILPPPSFEPPAVRAAKAPAPRPMAVKPQMPEVVRKQKQSRKFAYLLVEAGTQLGKALSPADQETLLYLYDTAGLPAEVILTVIAYAVKQGKGNMRYVEKTALDWADRDIHTIHAADAYLRRLSRQNSAFDTLSSWCDLPPRPSVSQKELAVKWLDEWKVSRELLLLAADTCLEKIGKFQYAYIDRILEGWRAESWDTVEKVKAGRAVSSAAPSAPASSPDSGFDVAQYEEMIRNYKPKYRKKGQA